MGKYKFKNVALSSRQYTFLAKKAAVLSLKRGKFVSQNEIVRAILDDCIDKAEKKRGK